MIMNKIKTYSIIQANSIPELWVEVNESIKGTTVKWQPFGNVVYDPSTKTYIQTVVEYYEL